MAGPSLDDLAKSIDQYARAARPVL
jgi:hypothetical protein